MSYKNIFQHYENCFETHGDSHLGVDWPNKEDAVKRYEVMLNVIKDKLARNYTIIWEYIKYVYI